MRLHLALFLNGVALASAGVRNGSATKTTVQLQGDAAFWSRTLTYDYGGSMMTSPPAPSSDPLPVTSVPVVESLSPVNPVPTAKTLPPVVVITSAPVGTATSAPIDVTPAPVASTPAPVVVTPAPVVPVTPAPVVPMTPPPIVPLTPEPVVAMTLAPVVPVTPAPVVPLTPAPVVPMTTAPVVPVTPAPVIPVTPAPVVPATLAPVVPQTPEPIIPATLAPVIPATPAPVVVATPMPTTAPVTAAPTPAPITRAPTTAAPVTPAPTPLPVTPIPTTAAPVTPSPTAAPIIPVTLPPTPTPTISPVTPLPSAATVTPAPASSIRSLISTVALQGGAEFENATSYQSQALAYLENTLSPQTDAEYIRYYALASIFYASSGASNKYTDEAFPNIDTLPGWITVFGWATDSNYCTWFGIVCTAGVPTEIKLPSNRLFGIFAPEVQLLADTLEEIDLFNNFFLTSGSPTPDEGNAWIAEMTNLRQLFFGTTSFEYPGIPTYIGQISTLEQLDVSNTFYSVGPIRAEAFAGLTNLNYVDLADNTYTGTIPQELIDLPNLEFFYLENCEFDVDLTLDFVVGMPAIFENWMDFTQFSGGIPTEIGTVSTLSSWSLTFCGLTGTIPTEIGNLFVSMDRLWLYQNQLTGTIPTELGNLNRLQFFYVEGNRLNGNMPESICTNQGNLLGVTPELGSDCDSGNAFFVNCTCCTCCGPSECGDFE